MINVLIVEDDFRIAGIHQQIMESIEGVRVVGQALRAKEVWGFLEEERIDLILLDIYMPDQLGTDLMVEIRYNYPETEFIMITAAKERELLARCMAAGVFHYLVKPIDLNRLKEVIQRYQNRQNLINNGEIVDQTSIDALFGMSDIERDSIDTLPKGINQLTLRNVKSICMHLTVGMTAEEVGERLGASRTTARRYLEYLVSEGVLRAELEYGIVGRPERKYFPS